MTSRELHNGVCMDLSWTCAGYRFDQAGDYVVQIERLPSLAISSGGAITPGRTGEHAVTFTATPIDNLARPSAWYRDGSSLDDVLALWSLATGHYTCGPTPKRPPSDRDLAYALAEPDEVMTAVVECYARCGGPLQPGIGSAVLTYLELAHARVLQLEAVLVVSILECLAQRGRHANYQPVIDHLAHVPVIAAKRVTRAQIEALVRALYRFRNDFLHTGVHPYDENVNIGGARTTTIGRVVKAARKMAKLALADALGFPETSEVERQARQIEWLFATGEFVPADVRTLINMTTP